MTTKEHIQDWLKEGRRLKKTHLIVVCDTFDWEDYPVFVGMKENVHEIEARYNSNMQKVMEVYRIESGNWEEQLNMYRSFTY